LVLHNDAARGAALGRGGGDLGVGGMRNTLAVVFDTWYNGDEDDVLHDYVTVLTSGPDHGEHEVVRSVGSRLTPSFPVDVADGLLHRARVAYYPTLREDLVDLFTVAPAALPYLADLGEGRRIGTLVVWVDNLNRTEPLLAVPININLALDAPAGEAIVGFTSATGHAFEKHDVLYWHFCSTPECPNLDITPADALLGLDYHQASNVQIGVNGTLTPL
jgi:hypothetical protein